MRKNNIIGKWGEKWALDYLKAKNYNILAQNYRTQTSEIDIIAEYQNEIVFIEVKVRKKSALSLPEEAITPAKMKRLIAAAKQWLQESNKENHVARLDVIAIQWRADEVPVIIHYENAIQDTYFYE
jgi:putative endonuclease